MKAFKVVTDEQAVESKLRQFIAKYYRIKIIQGLIITVSAFLILLFCLVIIGNILKVDQGIQNLSFLISFGVLGVVLGLFIIKPLLQRTGLIKGLNFKEASTIIQQKHKSIEDRIINVIELTQEKAGQNNALYDYAIAQKSSNISGFNFEEALSLKKLTLFVVRLAVLLVVCLAIVWLKPDFVKRGIGQMWSGNKQITELSRLKFKILNDSLEVESGKDFLLRFQILSELPFDLVTIRFGSAEETTTRVADGFEYLFKAVNSSVPFRLVCNEVISGNYELKTLNKPEISHIQIKWVPPAYAALENTVIDGEGNAEVLAGSTVFWSIKSVNTDELLISDGSVSEKMEGKGSTWQYEKMINRDFNYELLSRNFNGLISNYNYKISIIKDLFPVIDISESRDSSVSADIFIQGVIQDDYGFGKLEIIEDKDGNISNEEIKINKSKIYEEFYYTLKPDSINTIYHFRVWDNDRVTGPKYTDSRKISVRTISKEEIQDINNQLADSIKNDLFDGMNAIDKMEKMISQFRMEQVVGGLKPWEIQERMKELNQMKMEVVDFLNSISKADKDFTDNEDLLKLDEEITEKAKQIRELMEGLLDEEMKELLKQFEELAKDFNTRMADELTEKMEMNLEKLKEQMEMSLELFKKYEMEKDLIKQVEKLNSLADSLQNSSSKKDDTANILKQEFKKWEQEFDKNLEENQQLKKPMNLEDLENEREEVRDAAEEISKEKSGNARVQKRAKAATGLKKLAKKMENMLGMSDGEGEFVDLEDIRQIRNSLNDFSNRQEELNGKIGGVNLVNPIFTSVIREQKDLESKFLNIRDSLKSIGYKQPVITKIVGTELFHVETSFRNLFKNFSESRADVVRIEQNKIMTEINSIAVKLDELIRSMQNAQGKGKGDKGFTDRKKPKEGDQSGSEKLGETKSKQQSLKEQLKSAIQKMKAGANGKQERGQLARMLGEREMMRKALEQIIQGEGIGTEARQKANEALNMMKEVEKDIIYNRLGDQTLDKDNLIKTKLLEAENAEKERENENRRESKEFKGSFEPFRRELGKETDQNKALDQMLKYNELKLKKFYQDKYQKYIESTKK